MAKTPLIITTSIKAARAALNGARRTSGSSLFLRSKLGGAGKLKVGGLAGGLILGIADVDTTGEAVARAEIDGAGAADWPALVSRLKIVGSPAGTGDGATVRASCSLVGIESSDMTAGLGTCAQTGWVSG